MALCLTTSLLRDGQMSTQMPQPVQSSGATCSVYDQPLYGPPSLPRQGTLLKPAGAFFRSSGEYTFMRMAACGHISGQSAHWVQMSASQIGISCAMLCFSHCEVALGKVPSTGSADTGSRSPLPSSIMAVIRWTKSGAARETTGRRCSAESARAGTFTSHSAASDWSTAAKLRLNTVSPRLPYVLRIEDLIFSMASSRGRMPEIAKKQACVTVLMRPARPASLATASASTT